jgi:hypothetical protein
VVAIGLGDSKMVDLSVIDVGIDIPSRAFGILLRFLKRIKGNCWSILFWEFRFTDFVLEARYLMKP